MSRARNIKPGFFKNEILVDLPFEYRLLFIGLWTMADREGRLEDRPTKIKMEVFPADSVDVNAGLRALHDGGFILRYAIDGKALVQILAWSKHQNPHVKEAKSTIPAPGEHGASTVQAPTKAVASPADSLIPDSLIPEEDQKPPVAPKGGKRRGKEKITFPAFIAACHEAMQKPIPSDDSIFGFADDTGIPKDFLQLAWREFARKHRESGRMQKDWRAHFRDAVRRNWFKLWWFPSEGACDLTTAGVQLKRERDAEMARREEQAA